MRAVERVPTGITERVLRGRDPLADRSIVDPAGKWYSSREVVVRGLPVGSDVIRVLGALVERLDVRGVEEIGDRAEVGPKRLLGMRCQIGRR